MGELDFGKIDFGKVDLSVDFLSSMSSYKVGSKPQNS